MAKPLKVWNGTEWVEVAAQLVDTSSFLSSATASATYVANSLVENTGLQFADGSASAPSVSNDGDTDTGLFFPADNEVAIATGGTERVRVDSSGGVGIGTTDPEAKLHIASNANNQTTALIPTIILDNLDQFAVANDVVGQILFVSRDLSEPDEISGYLKNFTENAGTQFGLSFGTKPVGTAATERMRIDNAGLITGTGTSLGAWTAYTPTWTSSGTAPAIGNSDVTAAYMRIGKLVIVRIRIAFGSTATYGTNTYFFSHPVTARNTGGNLSGSGVAFDSSLGQSFRIFPAYYDTTTLIMQTNASPVGFVGTATPFTFAQSDVLQFNYWYEAA